MTWKNSRLGDNFDIKHGYAFKSKYFDTSGKYIVLTPGNFYEQGGFKVRENEKYYSADPPENFILKKGDLIIAMTEQAEGLLGSSAIVNKDNVYLHNQRLGLVIDLNENTLNRYFLYYLFNTEIVRHKIRATATGLKVRHTAPIRILNIEVSIPDIITQKRIAEILSKYDNLIDNNNRRIALLEESIHLLYKDWFVRLRFPAHESVKVVDGIPDGWSQIPVTQVIDFNPKTLAPKGEIRPYVPMESLSTNSMIINGIDTRLVGGGAKFKNGDTLLARITPCLENGKTAFVQFMENDDITATGSTEFIVMRSTQLTPYWVYCLSRSYNFRQHAINSMAGSDGRQRVKPECFERYYILFPPSPILKYFDKIAKPIFKQIHFLTLQNHRLKQARDLLLPRLMIGKITV